MDIAPTRTRRQAIRVSANRAVHIESNRLPANKRHVAPKTRSRGGTEAQAVPSKDQPVGADGDGSHIARGIAPAERLQFPPRQRDVRRAD